MRISHLPKRKIHTFDIHGTTVVKTVARRFHGKDKADAAGANVVDKGSFIKSPYAGQAKADM